MSIDKSILKAIVWGLVLGFITEFIAEHFMKFEKALYPSSVRGKSSFSYSEIYELIGSSGIAQIKGGIFVAPFGTTITVDPDKRNGKNYKNGLDYYMRKTLIINL